MPLAVSIHGKVAVSSGDHVYLTSWPTLIIGMFPPFTAHVFYWCLPWKQLRFLVVTTATIFWSHTKHEIDPVIGLSMGRGKWTVLSATLSVTERLCFCRWFAVQWSLLWKLYMYCDYYLGWQHNVEAIQWIYGDTVIHIKDQYFFKIII